MSKVKIETEILEFRKLIVELLTDLKKVVEETDPESEAYILMEKMAIVLETYTERVLDKLDR